MSEGMQKELPQGWESASLGDTLEVIRGVTYRKEDSSKAELEGFVPLLRANNIQGTLVLNDLVYVLPNAVSEAQKLRKGDVIVAASSGSASLVGKGAQLKHNWSGTFGAFCFALRPEPFVEERFLGWFIHTKEYRNRVSKASAGVNINNLRAEHIESTPLRLPPLAEQIRIADKLDELLSDLDAGVAALERVRSKIKHYRAAVLKAAVEGALTADWRAQHPDVESATDLLAHIVAERRQRWEEAQLRKFQAQGKTPPKDWKSKYQEPAAPDTTNLPGLPEGWCWATMDQVSSFITSGSRGWAEYYADSGPIFVRSQDIKTDRLILADVAHVTPPESSEGARTRLHRGDLLVTITGANVAKAALVDCEIDEAYVSQHVGMTRFVDVKIGPFIHVYVTASSGGRKLLLKVAYGAGKPGLNLDNLRELPVPLPPLAEQAAIVEAVEAQLSVIDHLEADLEAKLKSAQALRQSILRDAFEGKLVPQDPDDEPAAELLKRIAAARAERATTAAKAAKALEKPAIASTGRGRRRQLNASS